MDIRAWQDSISTIPSSTTVRLQPSSSRSAHPAPVKDDWEDDEDEDEDEEPPNAERNKQIWEDANTKVHHPMPAVIVARSSTVTASAAQLPPQGVFQQQPAMRILKRPTNSASPSSANEKSQANALDSLREREARYQAARERIFGVSEGGGGSPSNTGTPPPVSASGSGASLGGMPSTPVTRESSQQPVAQVKIVREPRGPVDAESSSSNAAPLMRDLSTAKGFGGRRTKAKPPSGSSTPAPA